MLPRLPLSSSHQVVGTSRPASPDLGPRGVRHTAIITTRTVLLLRQPCLTQPSARFLLIRPTCNLLMRHLLPLSPPILNNPHPPTHFPTLTTLPTRIRHSTTPTQPTHLGLPTRRCLPTPTASTSLARHQATTTPLPSSTGPSRPRWTSPSSLPASSRRLARL